ncbi:MAG: class I SAM-dependent methyltransferase [Alphaproteobacteria bacterium]
MSNAYKIELYLRRAVPEQLKIMIRAAKLLFSAAPPAAPDIPQHLLTDCKMLSSRFDFLHHVEKGGSICELGTLRGDFARSILAIAEPRTLSLVDVNIENCAADVLAHPVVKQHKMLSTDFLQTIPDETFDLIYVDADHSYQAVKADIHAAKSKVKVGGLLAFNDFARIVRPGLGQFGVHQAVCEFMVEDKWPMVYFCFQGEALYDVVLRRPAI